MVESGLRLLQRQGYADTSWRTLVQEGDLPFGSIRHFFPDGKSQLVEEALQLFVDRIGSLLDHLTGTSASPSQLVHSFFDRLADDFELGGHELGCPIASVALETAPRSKTMAELCTSRFLQMRGHVVRSLGALGASEPELWSDRILVAAEGGLVLSRLFQSAQTLRDSGTWISAQMD